MGDSHRNFTQLQKSMSKSFMSETQSRLYDQNAIEERMQSNLNAVAALSAQNLNRETSSNATSFSIQIQKETSDRISNAVKDRTEIDQERQTLQRFLETRLLEESTLVSRTAFQNLQDEKENRKITERAVHRSNTLLKETAFREKVVAERMVSMITDITDQDIQARFVNNRKKFEKI